MPDRALTCKAVRHHYVSYVPHRCLVFYFITFKSECQRCPLSKAHTHHANTVWLLAGCSDPAPPAPPAPFPSSTSSAAGMFAYLLFFFFSILASQPPTCVTVAWCQGNIATLPSSCSFLFVVWLLPGCAALREVRQEHGQASGFFSALGIVLCHGEKMNSAQAKSIHATFIICKSLSKHVLLSPDKARVCTAAW